MAFEPIRAFVPSHRSAARIRSNEAAIGSNGPGLTMTAPFQSKLIPHEDFIRVARAKRWSYPRIAAALLEQYGLKASPSTIFHFVKVRARRKRVLELPPSSSPATQPSVNPPSADGFFMPAPDPTTHEVRKPKYNLHF
jgi:hypothetical protein